MKYLIIIIVTAMTLASCSAPTYRSEFDISGAKILIGEIDRSVLEHDLAFAWFKTGYDKYVPETAPVESLKTSAHNLRFIVFLGTWCSDSKAEVPKYFKFFDALHVPADHITMFGLDRMKKAENRDAESYGVTKVPTLVVISGKTEIGRIVEQPRQGIEEDIRRMLDPTR